MPNYLNIGYYNFNSKSVESESFDYDFELNQSNDWKLGGGTGYIDYFIYLNQYQSSEVLAQLMSGFWARPTGVGYETETYYTTGLSGYQDIFVGETGITGYIVTPGGDEGRDFYTGAFPTFNSQTYLTGYISSGIYSSGVVVVQTTIVTGDEIDLLENLTGYASSFGMEKVQAFDCVDSADILKINVDRTLFNDFYNKSAIRTFDSFQLPSFYESGSISLFYNGLAQWKTGWFTSGNYLNIDGSELSDLAFFDVKSGDYKLFDVTGGLTSFNIPYSGQQIYLNGLNLISGYDFTCAGTLLTITARNTGINGYIFEYPHVLSPQTGNSSNFTLSKFSRNSSSLYFNGLRQKNKFDYLEGASVDLLSGNYYNNSGIQTIYNDNNLYWEE